MAGQFQYQQQPRGVKISGTTAAGTGSGVGFECNAAFTAAAILAANTGAGLGTWPVTSWITIAGTDEAGTTFTFLREGIYQVHYAIPWVPGGATTLQAGIGLGVAAAQLTANPLPANAGIFAASAFTSVTVEAPTLAGACLLPIRKSDLNPAATRNVMNLLMSNGADTTPPVTITAEQVSLWIVQSNGLWG